MNKIFRGYLNILFSITLVATIMSACSSDKPESNTTDDPTKDTVESVEIDNTPDELLTFEDTLEHILNEPWKRALYDDQSGFYESEFSYLTDETNFDEYLKYQQVTYEYPFDVMNIEVIDANRAGGDSAFVAVKVSLVSSQGVEQEVEETLVVYYTDGRWIKPTVSVIKQQGWYEDRIRQAIEDAEDE